MSSYRILDANVDLQSLLHGVSLNKIQNLLGLHNRVARQLLLDIDPQETIRSAQTTTPIYNQVYDYAVPADLKGVKIIDIAPQVNRGAADRFIQSYNQEFDITKIWTNQDSFTTIFNTGIKTMRINAPTLTAPVVINNADNQNGTWVAGGGATTPTTDTTNSVTGTSLKFNLQAGQTTGYLENSTMSQVDLTTHLNQATNFLYSFLPSASSVSAVEFRLGSSASNYYVLSATTNQQNNAFINGWNLLSYLWSSMTTVGAPDVSKINYIRITWTYDATLQTAVRLNDIFSALGTIMNIEYYSKYLFRNQAGTWQETTTAADYSDLINLDTESYNIYLNYLAYLACQQIQGLDAMFADGPLFLNLYNEGVRRYKAMNKSQVQLPQSTYYTMPRPNQTRFRRGFRLF